MVREWETRYGSLGGSGNRGIEGFSLAWIWAVS